MLVTGGKPEGIVLRVSRVSSSVAHVGPASAEESARQLAAGNWDQLAAGNWEKARGHRTLPLTGLLAGSGGFAGVEESARQLNAGNWDQLTAGNWGQAGGHRTLSGVIICCKRWSRPCRGKCPTVHCCALGSAHCW
jgi:hypothetical protein